LFERQTPEQQSVFAAHVAPVSRQQKPLVHVEPAATSQSRLSVHEPPSAIGPQPEAVQVPEQQSPAVVHGAVLPRQHPPSDEQRPNWRSQHSDENVHCSCGAAQHVPPLQ
jgi:hypothetical protein